jgi:hypothetical protein
MPDEPQVIEVKQPPKEPTDQQKVNTATEMAFGALVQYAKHVGLPVQPAMGLMYLPDQAVTRQFQVACRAVLKDLGVEVSFD